MSELWEVNEWWELRVVEIRGRVQVTTTFVCPSYDEAISEAGQQADKDWTIVHCEVE